MLVSCIQNVMNFLKHFCDFHISKFHFPHINIHTGIYHLESELLITLSKLDTDIVKEPAVLSDIDLWLMAIVWQAIYNLNYRKNMFLSRKEMCWARVWGLCQQFCHWFVERIRIIYWLVTNVPRKGISVSIILTLCYLPCHIQEYK